MKKIVEFIQDTFKSKEFIPLHEPRFIGNEKKYLNDCIDSTFVSSVGKYVDQFENGMIIAELENPPNEYSITEFGKSVNLSELSEFKNFKISLNGYPEFEHLFEVAN